MLWADRGDLILDSASSSVVSISPFITETLLSHLVFFAYLNTSGDGNCIITKWYFLKIYLRRTLKPWAGRHLHADTDINIQDPLPDHNRSDRQQFYKHTVSAATSWDLQPHLNRFQCDNIPQFCESWLWKLTSGGWINSNSIFSCFGMDTEDYHTHCVCSFAFKCSLEVL